MLTGVLHRLGNWIEASEQGSDPRASRMLSDALDEFIECVAKREFLRTDDAAKLVANDYVVRRARAQLEAERRRHEAKAQQ